MPWTKSEVGKHKKGLTDKQKEKWISVANSVRSECIKNGGNEKDCDAKAVRTANSKIKNNMERITTFKAANTYKAETKERDGKQYLVVPVVMIREGVHNGSAGAIFHKKERLQNSVNSWISKPVTIGHPVNQDGEFVSVNEEGISDNWIVGYVTNAHMEDDRLKAEAWLDISKIAAISPITLQMIQESEIMEVSVGVFAEEEETVGVWNNEEYKAIANNYTPDHLALLPGETGACSIADGCGIRVNQKKGGKNALKDEKISINTNENIQSVKYSIEVNGEKVYYERDCEVDENGTYKFVGEPRKVDLNNNSKKEVKMCEKCPEKVDALIAHKATHYTENDRTWLQELDEDKLDKMIPRVIRANEEKPEEKEVSVEEAWKVVQANSKGLDDYLENLPEGVQSEVKKGLEVFKEQREEVVKNIMDNSDEGVWTKDELDKMDFAVLQKIEKSVTKPKEDEVSDYSGQGAGSDFNAYAEGNDVEPYVIETEKDKK